MTDTTPWGSSTDPEVPSSSEIPSCPPYSPETEPLQTRMRDGGRYTDRGDPRQLFC